MIFIIDDRREVESSIRANMTATGLLNYLLNSQSFLSSVSFLKF